jgi:hypothetical protein
MMARTRRQKFSAFLATFVVVADFASVLPSNM